MKVSIIILAMLSFTVPLGAEIFATRSSVDRTAIVLQRQLPALAIDHLFEAERRSAGWRYVFRTRAEKAWLDEVSILLRPLQGQAQFCEVEVQAFRKEGGFFKTSTKPQPLEAREWTAKIRKLLIKSDLLLPD